MFPKQAALCTTRTHVFAFHSDAVIFERHVWQTFNFISVLLCVLVFWLLSLKHVFVSQEKQMMVYVERRVADDATLSKDEAFGSIRNQLCTFREGETAVSHHLSHNKSQ